MTRRSKGFRKQSLASRLIVDLPTGTLEWDNGRGSMEHMTIEEEGTTFTLKNVSPAGDLNLSVQSLHLQRHWVRGLSSLQKLRWGEAAVPLPSEQNREQKSAADSADWRQAHCPPWRQGRLASGERAQHSKWPSERAPQDQPMAKNRLDAKAWGGGASPRIRPRI